VERLKEATVVCFKASQHLLKGTEDNHEDIDRHSANHYTPTFDKNYSGLVTE
jgi:hypothetical protein